MKIAVAAPSITDFYFSPHRSAALGAAAVCRALELAGHEPVLFNFMNLKKRAGKVPLPAELSYLTDVITENEFGPTAFFTSYKRMGPEPALCAANIVSIKPDAVWISCFAFAYSDDAILLARAVRDLDSSIPITVGGGGPSALPSYFLNSNAVSTVCIGEVEPAVKDVENSPTGKWDSGSISYASEETMVFSPVVMPPYRSSVCVSLSLTRGCPKHCAFCSNFLTHGRKFRRTPLRKVREEINRISIDPTYSVHFAFEDDNILLDPDYFFTVLDIIHRKFPGFSYSAENGLDYLLLNEAVIDRLIQFGITQFNLSAGSMDSSTLNNQRRLHDFQHLQNILSYIHSKKVKIILYCICGLSEDTPNSVVDSLLELSTFPADVGISPFYAVPGLPGFESDEFFLSKPAYLCKGSSLFPWNGSLTTEQLMTAFRLARFINLMKHPERDQELLEICFHSRKIYTRVRVQGTAKGKTVPAEACDAAMVSRFFAGMHDS